MHHFETIAVLCDSHHIVVRHAVFSSEVQHVGLPLQHYDLKGRDDGKIFTITKYSGMDPERPQNDGDAIATGIDWASYPNPRTFLFGLDFKF